MPARAMVLLAIAVIAGAGLCLLDADDTASADLCLSSPAIASGLLPAIPLIPTGHILTGVASAYHFYPSDLPAPPPRA